MYTTIQKVRQKAGFQNYRIEADLYETGSSSIWSNNSADIAKFVPTQSDGATITTVGDVYVKYNGLSIGFSSISDTGGYIDFGSTGYASGSSLVATYASSPLSNEDIFDVIMEANSVINSNLSKRYSLPLGACIPMLTTLETNYASAQLLINSYGVSGQDSAEDGYQLLESVMNNLRMLVDGEINLTDIDGNIISDSNSGAGGGNAGGGTGVRVDGYIFTASQEEFSITKPYGN